MSFILHLDTYWVDRRDPIGIEPVKSFRARLDRRRRRLHFLRPRLCEGVFPKGIRAMRRRPISRNIQAYQGARRVVNISRDIQDHPEYTRSSNSASARVVRNGHPSSYTHFDLPRRKRHHLANQDQTQINNVSSRRSHDLRYVKPLRTSIS